MKFSWRTVSRERARQGLTGLLLCLLLTGAHAETPLERARALVRAGQWDLALPLLTDTSFAGQLLRVEALIDSGDYEGAHLVLEPLLKAAPQAGPPENFRFFFLRGRLALNRGEFDLAERNLREASRLAATVDQKVETLDRTLNLHRRRERWDKAQSTLDLTESLLPSSVSDYRLAEHLLSLGEYQRARGRRAEAMASMAGARSLFTGLGMPVRAARAQVDQALVLYRGGDLAKARSVADNALVEFTASGDPASILEGIEALLSLTYELPEGREATMARIATARRALPEGKWANAALAEELYFRNAVLGESVEKTTHELLDRSSSDPDSRVRLLKLAASISSGQGRLDEADSLLREAVALADQQTLHESRGNYEKGPLLLNLAVLARERREYERSLQLVHQALEAQPGENWKPWRVVAGHYEALLSIIPTYDVELARREIRQGLDEAETLESTDHRANFLTSVLAALAVNQSTGEDVLDPSERMLGPYDATARTMLDEMLAPPGASARYLALYDTWIGDLRTAANAAMEVRALTFRGLFLEASGKMGEARAALLESAELSVKRKLNFNALTSYLLLARLEHLDGRPAAALTALEEANRISATVSLRTRRFYALLLASYQRRLGFFAESLRSYESSVNADPKKAWNGLYGQGMSLEGLGRIEPAIDALDAALAMEEMSSRPISRATIEGARGRLLLAAGRVPGAIASYGKALSVLVESAPPELVEQTCLGYTDALVRGDRIEEAFGVASSTLDRLLQRGSASPDQTRKLFERVATLALRAGHDDQALRYLDLSRSAELVGSVQLTEIPHNDPATRALLASLETLKSRLEELQRESSRNEASAKSASLSQALATTRGEFFSKLDELKRREPDFEALVQLSGSDLSAIQAGLDANTSLVEYFPAEDSLYVFVVTRASFHLHQVAISRKDLTRTVQAYGALLRDPESSLEKLAVSSHLIYSLTVAPIVEDLGTRRRLLVVPSGPLWNVSFEEVRDSAGRSLDEDFEVGLLTSADLLRTLAQKGSGDASRRKTVLLGAPDSGVELPGAQAELAALASFLPHSLELMGEKATSVALRTSAQQADLLHIASHSGVGAVPGESYITLADGPFRLEQIYGLSLRPGALVVLSSCESALGEVSPGREVTSLASAFNIAGASTVIASHWEVDDATAVGLFLSFYRHLGEGKERGEALRQARRETAKQYPHPYYWAAFSLFGSPR